MAAITICSDFGHKYLINKFSKSNQRNKIKERKSKVSERSEMRRKGRVEGRKKWREGKKGGRNETRKRGRMGYKVYY